MFNRNVCFDFPDFLEEWYNERKKINLPNISVLGKHKGVEDGIDKDTNCWF